MSTLFVTFSKLGSVALSGWHNNSLKHETSVCVHGCHAHIHMHACHAHIQCHVNVSGKNSVISHSYTVPCKSVLR